MGMFSRLSAFRQENGKVVIFRPDENAKRMYKTAVRWHLAAEVAERIPG